MSEINILDSIVFNRIAAGEVVESPRSVVKELVENSIDAGANTISVEIRGGGIDYISVTDNGKGLGHEDMELAFLPHATSKIQSLDDLNAILTLGFRGEALPSIASVSDVSMVSRRDGDTVGYSVSYQNGNLIDKGEIGAVLGTTVCVQNLFLNIPARRKFLKKPASEASRITDLLEKLILANPNIAFTYVIDDSVIYRSDGAGKESALYAIYGQESEHFLPIFDTMSHIKLSGFISEPLHSKHNRKDQTLIVNNRVVENEEIGYSIFLAYKDFLMTRRYPAYILYIEIPHDLVDVNVHPNKTSIKFVDITPIKKTVYRAVRRMISVPANMSNLFGVQPESNGFECHENLQTNQLHSLLTESVFKPSHQESAEAQASFHEKNHLVAEYSRIPFPRVDAETLREESAPSGLFTRADIMEQLEREIRPENRHINEPELGWILRGEPQMHEAVEQYNTIHVAGKLFQTYLLIQSEDAVYLIDQHAAHERILYDRYMSEIENGKLMIQELLIPYTFTVTHEEALLLESVCADLCAIGFRLNLLGECTFSLSATPSVCAELNLQEFVQGILNDSLKSLKKSGFMKDKIAQAACKAAVKGKHDLKESEIVALINQMRASGSVPLCPHGRPTVIKLTKLEIDKMFKRVVS